MNKVLSTLGAVAGGAIVVGTGIMYQTADAAFLANPTSTVAQQNYVDTFVLAMLGLALGTVIMAGSIVRGMRN